MSTSPADRTAVPVADEQLARILSTDSVAVKAGIIAFLRDGRRAEVREFDYADTQKFVGEAAGHSILLPHAEVCELIDDGVVEIADDYTLRLTIRPAR